MVVEPDLDLVDLVPAVVHVDEAPAARLGRPHRPGQQSGEHGCDQVLGVDGVLGAEPAADVGRDHPEPSLGHMKQAGQVTAEHVGCLGRRPRRQSVVPPVGDAPEDLEWCRGGPLVDQPQ
jgi:hypothetical protein